MRGTLSRATMFSRPELFFAAAAALVVLLSASSVDAQQVFTTCTAIAEGYESSVDSEESEVIRPFCSVVRGEIESVEVSGITEMASVAKIGDTEMAVLTPPPEESVGVSTSSIDQVSFTVFGSEPVEEIFDAQTSLSTLPSNVRPEGPWVSIGTVGVSSSPYVVWKKISNITDFFVISLAGMGTTITRENETAVLVEIEGSGNLTFLEVERDEETRFLVFEIIDIDPSVFPGFDFEGTDLYVQIRDRDDPHYSSDIELGWRARVPDVGGDRFIGVQLFESLVLEMLINLGRQFGRLCDDARNTRTIEGDCNNLIDPEQGIAGGALRRLEGGIDPAYPGGNRSIPAGPLDVNVRNVSNGLFAMSPGAVILEPQLDELRKTCVNGSTGDTTFTVCPLEYVLIKPSYGFPRKIPFKTIDVNDCEEIIFQYASFFCKIDILLKCSGETVLDLAEDPCGADTNRLFSPVGCVIIPGEDSVLANPQGLTDLFFSFGQFLDHDIGLSPLSQINEEQPGFNRLSRGPPPPDVEDDFPIDIPDNDFHFDREEFEFTRATFSEEDTDSQVNVHSSYLDGSHIYGVNFRRSRLLRSFEGGRLALSDGNLPPFNGAENNQSIGATVENGPNTDSRFFVAGDVRANEQALLLCLHVVFLREHNRVADEVSAAFPDFDDERVYQIARHIVIAEFQVIVYKEWLPLLLGSKSPNPDDFVYDETLDVTASAIFTTAAFRFGHSMVGTNLLTIGPGKHSHAAMELIPIRDVFFAPELIMTKGIEPFLRGGAWHPCKEMDNKVVDEIRNFLIIDFDLNVTMPDRFDLVSLNLQRGRDIGIPSFNDVRKLFNLSRYDNFSDFVSDPNLADLAMDIYGDVDHVELFFGGLVEDEVHGSQLGETFSAIVAEQFVRFRDADRFFYKGITFDDDLIASIPVVQDIIDDKVRMADVILRNTNISMADLGMKDSVFQI